MPITYRLLLASHTTHATTSTIVTTCAIVRLHTRLPTELRTGRWAAVEIWFSLAWVQAGSSHQAEQYGLLGMVPLDMLTSQ